MNPCPSGDGTTTPAPATTVASNATTASAGSSGGGGSSTDDLLVWAIPALFGAVTWLALTVYLIYRFCCPCKNPCSGCSKPRPAKPVRVTPEPPREVKPPPPKAKPPPPPKPKTPPPPVPPPPPVVKPDPYMFGFWKETYTDQDQKSIPRGNKPTAIENMPRGEGNSAPPEHLRLGPPGADANLPRFLPGNTPALSSSQVGPLSLTPPPPKKKKCTIL
ncbi:hypothetical protein PoB_003404900 [Plakobranchus ocellatus]|uniref:Uncharacterized protein n=1 Tax=Plakobranchus ocellatus TaxID=259542 RepID=A0AAV4AMX1_9GAST|nr:hypothetical protein PoB_003404900 [Plakobranchus ocellatus]